MPKECVTQSRPQPEQRPDSDDLPVWCQQELESLKQRLRDEVDATPPLYSAAGRGDTAEVSRLLASGVHPDPINSNGSTPLHRAVSKGHLHIAQLLVEGGADVNAPTTYGIVTGDTPLHLAVEANTPEIVRYLLSKGGAPDARNDLKQTPLHLAVMNSIPKKSSEQQAQIVQVLLRHGANVNAKSDKGLTPLSYVIPGSELASMLRSHAGKHAWELGIRGFLLRVFHRI